MANIREFISLLNERLMPDKKFDLVLKRINNSLAKNDYRDTLVSLIFDVYELDKNDLSEYVCRIWVSRLNPKSNIMVQFDIFKGSEEAKAFKEDKRAEVRKMASRELERFANTLPDKP